MTWEQIENINEIFKLAETERERHRKEIEEERQHFMKAFGIKKIVEIRRRHKRDSPFNQRGIRDTLAVKLIKEE